MGLDLPSELVRMVFHNLEEGLIYCDMEGRVLEINRGAEAILALEGAGEEMTGQCLAEMGVLRREDLKPMAAGLNILNAPAVIRRPGGHQRNILISAFPVTGEGGEAGGVLLTLKPVLPQPGISVESGMMWGADYLEQITANLHEGVGFTDMEGKVFFANPAFGRIVGLAGDELRQKRLPSCIKPVGRPLLFQEALESTVRQGHWEGELEVLVGEERKTILITTALVKGEEDDKLGISLIVRDITGRKRLEEEMEESRRELAVIYGMLRYSSDYYDLAGTTSETISRILQALHAEAGAVLIWDRAEARLLIQSAAGFTYRGMRSLEEEAQKNQSLFKVFQGNEPWLVEDATAGGGRLEVDGKRGRLRSLLAVPVQSGAVTLGVIIVGHKEAGAFSLRQAETLTSMASRMGVVFELARTVNSLQEKVEELGLERDFSQATLECVPCMVFRLDGEGRVTSANRRASEILGYPEGEWAGKPFFRLVSTRDRGAWRQFAGQAAQGGTAWLEAHMPGRERNEVEVEMRASPVGSQATGGEGLLVVATVL